MFRRRRADPAGSVQSFQYPLSRLAKATNNFSDRNKIGSGGSGVVYKGKIDGREVAIKKLHGSSVQRLVDAANEVSLLCSLVHDNLVKLLGFSSGDGEYLLVYEYIPNEDLYSYLSASEGKRTKLNWEMRFNIINGIARGLSYLHHDLMDPIIHRDLKPANVLLDENYNAKIADFGLSKSFAKNKTHNTTRKRGGTYEYMAPELWSLKRYSSKSDVYSFGLLILEIIAGCTSPAYERNRGKVLHHEVWRRWKNKEPLIEVIDESLRNHNQQDLIKHCILIGLHCVQDDFNKRPKMEDVLEMLNNTSNVLREPDKPGFFGGPEDSSNIIEFQSTEATCANSELQRTGHAIPEDNSTKLYSMKDLMIATNFFSRFEHGDYHSVIWRALAIIWEVFVALIFRLLDWMTPEIKMTNEQLSPVKGRIHYTAYRGVLDRQDVIVEEYFFYGCLPHLVVQTGPSEWINIFTLFSFTEKYGGILLPSMRHRNIVDILGYCTEKPEKIFVVFKCPRNGNLRNYLFRSNHNKEWSIHERIIEGIADGISYLHYGFQHEYLIHGDLNLSSIWLDDCWNAQISNFSYTRVLDMNGTCTAVASLLQSLYTAPETSSSFQLTRKSDIYSYGIILLQILIDKKGGGFSAYPSSLLEVWNKWKRDKMLELLDPEIQNCCPEKSLRYFQIALLCIQAEPDKRPDAKEVVTMLSSLDDLPIPTPPDFRF